jgi:hypothetical protein
VWVCPGIACAHADGRRGGEGGGSAARSHSWEWAGAHAHAHAAGEVGHSQVGVGARRNVDSLYEHVVHRWSNLQEHAELAARLGRRPCTPHACIQRSPCAAHHAPPNACMPLHGPASTTLTTMPVVQLALKTAGVQLGPSPGAVCCLLTSEPVQRQPHACDIE